MANFTFYKHLDSVGSDLFREYGKSIDELKEICIKNKRCIAFNSLGYLKYYINDIDLKKRLCVNLKIFFITFIRSYLLLIS